MRKNLALSTTRRSRSVRSRHPWRVGAMSSSAQNGARITFACGVTALVVISVYYGMLWLFGAH
jgi:hypothetical protein